MLSLVAWFSHEYNQALHSERNEKQGDNLLFLAGNNDGDAKNVFIVQGDQVFLLKSHYDQKAGLTYKLCIGNVEFPIPDDYLYEIEVGNLRIDVEDGWLRILSENDVRFQIVEASMH